MGGWDQLPEEQWNRSPPTGAFFGYSYGAMRRAAAYAAKWRPLYRRQLMIQYQFSVVPCGALHGLVDCYCISPLRSWFGPLWSDAAENSWLLSTWSRDQLERLKPIALIRYAIIPMEMNWRCDQNRHRGLKFLLNRQALTSGVLAQGCRDNWIDLSWCLVSISRNVSVSGFVLVCPNVVQ
jgi:hypothetical protein